MRKTYIAMAVIGAALLSSCQREKETKELSPLNEKAVAFAIGGDAATRSDTNSPRIQQGVIIPAGQDENGTTYYLEETVVDLDRTEPATKATPAYTENLGVLYRDQMFVHAVGGSFVDATYANLDDKILTNGGWRYQHTYDVNPWTADETTPIDFYFRMPVDMAGVVAEDGAEPYTYDKGSITFDYVSPATAAQMQDLLFAYRKLNYSDYKTYLPDGAPVLFKHALTGVKFAIGNTESDRTENQIAIKEVIFNGLLDMGTCTISPTAENGGYQDIPGTYSSANDVVWNNPDYSTDEGTHFSSGLFGTTDADGNFTQTLVDYTSGSFANKGAYPDSFSAGGNTQNLNDADATQTFWFMPQTIENTVTLTVRYTFGGKDYEWTIDFGKTLKAANVVWKAGQLRTYTLKIDDVNVMIDDTVNLVDEFEETVEDTQMDEGEEGSTFKVKSYKGSTKTGLSISNTGNTDAYIRAAIIGQWLDDNGNPVFGFTDYADQVDPVVGYVDSWYQDQFVTKEGATAPARTHGTFVGLVGYDSSYSGDWVYNTEDGYYYYTKVVKAKESVPASDPLFVSYTVGTPPAVRVAGNVKNVYFELQVATQAISAKKLDGSFYTYDEAWAIAKSLNNNQ